MLPEVQETQAQTQNQTPCYFLLNYATQALQVPHHALEHISCYFLLNYAKRMLTTRHNDYNLINLLFSFELCLGVGCPLRLQQV